MDVFTPLTAIHAAEAILAPDESGLVDAAYLARLGMSDRMPGWKKLREQVAAGRNT